MGSYRFWRDGRVWTVAAAALLLRLVYLHDLAATPFFSHPQMDALYHDAWARRLAAGDWIGSGVFFRAPLYPYFLGVLYRLFGPAYTLVRVVQFAIGTGTVVAVMRFLDPRFGRFAALAGGALLACYGPLIYFEGELLLVVLEAPLNLAALWTLQRAMEHPTVRRWVTGGLVLGLAALARPIVLAVPPVLAVLLVVRRRRRGALDALVYGAAVLAMLSPVLIRNYAVGRDLVPVASQGGLNFYLGNHAGADGRAALAGRFRATWTGGIEDARTQAEAALGRPLKPSEVSRYWYREAFGWIRSHPGDWLRLEARKLAYFWDAFEIPNNQDYYYFSRLTRLFRTPLVFGFGLLGPLALAGLALALLRRRMPIVIAAVPLVLMTVVVSFFVCGRFRASLVPLFVLWAGIGAGEAVRAVRGAERHRLLLYGAILLAAGAAMNLDCHGFRARYSTAESHLRLGVFYGASGRSEDAIGEYRRAVEADPGFVEGWNNMGIAEAQAGRQVDARHAFEEALRRDPDHPKALSNLAALAFGEGNRAEADSLARRILALDTRDPGALYNTGVVLGNLGDLESARRAFHRLVAVQPENAAARLGEARALAALGRRDEARAVLQALPEARRTEAVRALLKRLPAGPTDGG